MGQNYSGNDYKKTYEGDYVKSFDLSRSRNLKAPYQGLEKTAEAVSPDGPRRARIQRAAASYSSTVEKKAETPASTPRVLPRVTPTERTQYMPKDAPARPQVQPTPPPQVKTESVRVEEKKTETKKPIETKQESAAPPAYKQPEQKRDPRVIRPTVEVPQNTFYSPSASLDHPIRLIGQNKYEVLKTGKIVDERGAREILSNDGYQPKNPILLYILLLIAFFTMAFNPVMPIVLVVMSWLGKNRQHTNYQKTVGEHTVKYEMPASDEEMQGYNSRSHVLMVVGLVLTVISIAILANK